MRATRVVPLLPLAALWAAGAAAQAGGDPRNGRELYLEKCALCHGGQGQGWDWARKVDAPPYPVPDLRRLAANRSDQHLFDAVKGGGEAVGRTRFMPPFGFQLSDREVWDLVAHMRSLGSAP